MISINSSSMDELKSIWKKIESEYEMLEKIHVDKDTLDYKMVVTKEMNSEMSPVLKSLAEKTFENDRLLNGDSFFLEFSYHNFLKRIEAEISGAKRYPGIARLTFIWKELTQMEKKMLYGYMKELNNVCKSEDFSQASAS